MRCHQCKEEFIDRRKEEGQFIQIVYYDHMLFHPACLSYWKEEEEKKEKARKEREKEKEKKDIVLSNGQSKSHPGGQK